MNNGRAAALVLGTTSDIGRAATAADPLAVAWVVNEDTPHRLAGSERDRTIPRSG